MMRRLEPIHPVHDPWVKLNQDNNMQWTPHKEETYCSSQVFGKCGPSSLKPLGSVALQEMVDIARSTESLAQFFLSIFMVKLFEYITRMRNIYTYKEWVIEKK
eukprot:CAMPEP_0171386528 /NCGR_PEP_ID=MMETSP0879-20121228/39538_1 /TAXON_ID=67004 /ORGANISM="Thalassiosira weissflogii, Strain CCMP1336" /LENGTH=102 /DNA_ID=CAMNT_0011898845 /DNA_START=1018 /DNA_END=1327 /DNA_ORIENTATION=+